MQHANGKMSSIKPPHILQARKKTEGDQEAREPMNVVLQNEGFDPSLLS